MIFRRIGGRIVPIAKGVAKGVAKTVKNAATGSKIDQANRIIKKSASKFQLNNAINNAELSTKYAKRFGDAQRAKRRLVGNYAEAGLNLGLGGAVAAKIYFDSKKKNKTGV